ncbi:acetyltransferase [Tardiphaga sp. vice304]|uniref:acetyltransferase n=1 Tax=Tardiphaga sp. vice304 TaxID=2592817 RepID=UPI00116395DB|nr:acetyltransferase [Tardiphaga sp. vice304]QDM28154.1 acetyltransferase [Tardiphaga sp. vice304]
MTRLILFGVGSPILIDVAESAFRAGLSIEAGIRNMPSVSFMFDAAKVVLPEDITREMLDVPFIVPIFTPGYRQSAAREASIYGLRTPYNLIDPSVAIPRISEFGQGCYINAGCTLGGGSVFGSFVFINRSASIGHHAKIGSFASIGPGVTIAGQVTIGKGAVVGAGATLLPSVTLGENSVVGAGSVVTRDVPDECLAFGNPARVVSRGIAGYRGQRVT